MFCYQIEKGLHALFIVCIACQFLEFSQLYSHWHHKFRECKRIAICSQIHAQRFNDFFNDSVTCLLCVHMFLCKFEWSQRVRDCLILQLLGLRVEEWHIARIEWVQNVLSCGDKLARLRINHHNHVKKLHMEWEVLDIVGQSDDADNELDERMDQEC